MIITQKEVIILKTTTETTTLAIPTLIKSDLAANMIAEHNDLIKSVADMKMNCLKIFEIAVSKLNMDSKNHTVSIKKQAIFDILQQHSANRTADLRKVLQELLHNAQFHLLPHDDQDEEILIAPLSQIKWSPSSDTVQLTFTTEILPYITFLKHNFTQYKLKYIVSMHSKYSIVLYKILLLYSNQYEYYLHKGSRRQDQLEQLHAPVFDLLDLKRQLNVLHKYTRSISDFEHKVLKVATDEINEHTNLHVTYQKIHAGRKVTAIRFVIDRKTQTTDTSQHLDTVMQTQADRQAQENQDIVAVLASPYTQMLLALSLLNANDLTNHNTLLGLARHVYPKYKLLENQLGRTMLQQHLTYVHDHMNNWQGSPNIAKYLNKAITDLLRKRQIGTPE